MSESEINDVREQKLFKGISFSKFKKTDVKKELLNSLLKSNVEPSCYWSAELICAGHYEELWDIILHFYCKNIHIGNPKLSIYLELRIDHFKEIVRCGYISNELRLRNNDKIRKLFSEIMCVLCESKRKHSFNEIKIKKEDFDLTSLTDRFKAPHVRYAENILLDDDPKEIFVAINELSFNVSQDGKNIIDACYWIEWILDFELICKHKKIIFKCERRNVNVESKYQMDVVWLIWDIFTNESKQHNNLIKKIVNSLKNLFMLKYRLSCCGRRKYILYFVVSLLLENVKLSEDMINDKTKECIANVTKKINCVYKQIKKNEVSPETDYLFMNTKTSNLEKTIEKLDKMKSFEETFIPRI